MERIYQDTEFSIDTLNGIKVAELKGVVDTDNPDDTPILIYLKTELGDWYRFFLDAGLAFWEEGENIASDVDEDTREVDYAEIYKLRNKHIIKIRCENSTIRVLFVENNEFILKYKDETDMDSDSIVILKSHNKKFKGT